jgi:hypothetical protein
MKKFFLIEIENFETAVVSEGDLERPNQTTLVL